MANHETRIQRFPRTILRGQGYQVLQVISGQEAIARITARRPHAVLSALALLDLDGLEVLRRTEPGAGYRLCKAVNTGDSFVPIGNVGVAMTY